MNEIWKEIPGFEGRYQVTPCGKIRSLTRRVRCASQHGNAFRIQPGKVLKTDKNINSGGYIVVGLTAGRAPFSLHRLIALTFLGEPTQESVVNHKNGNKLDNRIENLEWITQAENCKHAKNTGLLIDMAKKAAIRNKGAGNPRAKILEVDVLAIRESKEKTGVIAQRFGITTTHVRDIRKRKSWSHVF